MPQKHRKRPKADHQSPNSLHDLIIDIAGKNRYLRIMVIILLGISAACFALWTTLPEEYRRNILDGISNRASGGISACLGIDGLSPNPGGLKGKTIKLALLESGNIAYVRNIEISFRQALDTCARKAGFELQYEGDIGPLSPASHETRKKWDETISRVQKRMMSPDYWITIGTQASLNLKRFLGESINKTSILFAGVTDPVCSNLVSKETKRADDVNLGGVRYGGEPTDYLGTIAEFFPEKKIIYVYHQDHEQDTCFANDLKKSRFFADHKLVLRPLDHLPTLDDLPEKDVVYFSWYTFEEMFENNKGTEILSERIVVATTKNNVDGEDLAPIGVTGNDVDIGKKAAEVFLKDLFSVTRLGHQDIVRPSYEVFVNCKTSEKRALHLPPRTVAQATKINCT
jgi:hypothetical protein